MTDIFKTCYNCRFSFEDGCVLHKWKPTSVVTHCDSYEAKYPKRTITTTFKPKYADNGWIDWVCVNCGYKINLDTHLVPTNDYCPHCGAKVVSE